MIVNDLRRDNFISRAGVFVTPRFFSNVIIPRYEEFTKDIVINMFTEGTTAGVFTETFIEVNEVDECKLHIINVEGTDIKIILEDISNVMVGRNDNSISYKSVLESLVQDFKGE